jgi:hypothetical protein
MGLLGPVGAVSMHMLSGTEVPITLKDFTALSVYAICS